MALSLQANHFNIFTEINDFVFSFAKSILSWFGKVGLFILALILLPILVIYIFILISLIKKYRKIIKRINYNSLDYEELIEIQKAYNKILKKHEYKKEKRNILYKNLNLLYNDVYNANNIVSKEINVKYNNFFTSENSRNEYEKAINGLTSW